MGIVSAYPWLLSPEAKRPGHNEIAGSSPAMTIMYLISTPYRHART
jgi:hypothetical protein